MFEFIHALKMGLVTALATLLSLINPPPYIAQPVSTAPTQQQATTSQTKITLTPATSTSWTQAEKKATTTQPSPKTGPQKQTSVTQPQPPAVIASATSTKTTSVISWSEINEGARSATVNILCSSTSGGLFQPISGSGIIIDSRGVILINAHVGQYFLLKNYRTQNFIDCVVRQGSPASPRFKAELVYISPSWVQQNHQDILEQNPLGTGENDFALLYISGTTNPSALLPSQFPFVPMELVETTNIIGHPVLVTAYPAGFFGGVTIQTNLYLSSAPSNIHDVYTFADNTIDVLSLSGSVVAQQGSSGGAVIGPEGKLIGIIVTSTEAKETGQRNLGAITLSHINRRLKQETGLNLSELLSRDIAQVATEFNQNIAPKLTQIFITVLEKASR